MRSGHPWLAVVVLAAFGRPEARGTQWTPRLDLGVAAVDRRTGAVLWEAWDEADMPADAGRDVRGAASALLAQREPTDAEDLGPRLPAALAPDRIVTYHYDSDRNQIELILARGSAESPGEGLARISFRSTGAFYALGPETFYVLTDGRVYALGSRGATDGGTWRADWTVDLVDSSVERERAVSMSIWRMRVDGDGLWVADDRRIRRFGPGGRVDFDHVILEPWEHVRNGFGSSLTLGEGVVYFRHGGGVIAVDRTTSRERWRLPTFRSPYPSRVLEATDLVFVQVGSNCPRTITGALAEGLQPAARRTPEGSRRLVAAAALLRSYGDGWPRASLRRSIAEARRGKNES